ncbi:hypothetical protein M427DRAFT_62024 [Gonapodya prolifera JEL478]|uniref:Uncharacterized protein n=1 Tax=Gonapodya prolifera (strain JEL478) TaxID=1344416 RepID=A0A139A1J5_GONPJ|nr:hypothetical protein M427DRAFT_62024 [Gonapodya prolifera JEL478]|eukprot:KXS10498.1 hypothetical protein M427DRAFT_62024 [Gonapodya prolifera JEL478]
MGLGSVFGALLSLNFQPLFCNSCPFQSDTQFVLEPLFVASHRCLPVLQIFRLPLCFYEGRPHFIKRLAKLEQSLLVLVPSRVQVSPHVEDFPVSIPQLHDQAILLR